jgi:hypothetical protein
MPGKAGNVRSARAQFRQHQVGDAGKLPKDAVVGTPGAESPLYSAEHFFCISETSCPIRAVDITAVAAATCRIEHALPRGRIIDEFARRPNRPRREIAAAIRTDAIEPVVDAIAAEGALEGADHRVGGLWRQILVAAFAAWTQFEHDHLRSLAPMASARPAILHGQSASKARASSGRQTMFTTGQP